MREIQRANVLRAAFRLLDWGIQVQSQDSPNDLLCQSLSLTIPYYVVLVWDKIKGAANLNHLQILD